MGVGEAGLDLAPGAVGGVLGARPRHALVGRNTELAQALAALPEAERGQGHFLLLAGEPGVGKTRLAQEVALRAHARGFRVLVGRCYEEYTGVPFAPFADPLTELLAKAPEPIGRQ